jgi:hypothetical protein
MVNTKRPPKVALNVKVTPDTKRLVDEHAARRDRSQAGAADELLQLGDLAYRFVNGSLSEREFSRAALLLAFPHVGLPE